MKEPRLFRDEGIWYDRAKPCNIDGGPPSDPPEFFEECDPVELVAELEKDRDEMRSLLAGVVWMFDEGHFERSIKHDAESDYMMRSLRLVQFIARIVAAAKVI